MRTRFVFLVAGDELAYYQQAHGACLSLLNHGRADFEILVRTTRPDRFAWLAGKGAGGAPGAIQVLPLDPGTLERWRGPHGDFFRSKFFALQEAARLGPAHAVLMDCDVLVRESLDRLIGALDAGACLMHRPERPLDARRGTREAFSRLYGRAIAGVRIEAATLVHNSGVVGIPAGRSDLIDRALRVNDALLDARLGYFAVEQVAWSAALASERIESAAPEIDHYWGNKRGYLALVNRVLTEALFSGWTPTEASSALGRIPIDVPARVWDRWWHRHVLRWLRIPPQ